MSSFAEKQLLKYGWQKGQAIGKDGSGDVKPLTVDFQTGTKGLGVNEGNFHPWWDDVYNKAAAAVKPKISDVPPPTSEELKISKRKRREQKKDKSRARIDKTRKKQSMKPRSDDKSNRKKKPRSQKNQDSS